MNTIQSDRAELNALLREADRQLATATTDAQREALREFRADTIEQIADLEERAA